jgi:hypothetical protein
VTDEGKGRDAPEAHDLVPPGLLGELTALIDGAHQRAAQALNQAVVALH